jgi:hypothetical protein
MTTERFMVLCYKCQLTLSDLQMITVGMALDYIQEYVESSKQSNKPRKRKATQADMDAF